MASDMSRSPPQDGTPADLYGAVADQAREFGETVHELCVEAAPFVGDLTGKAYGYGTLRVTDNPAVAKLVDTAIDFTVTRGWPDTCDLPANLTSSAKDVATTVGETTMPLLDNLANLLGEIATDVRQQVVEQGWFGRTVTGPEKYDDFLSDRYGSSPNSPTGPSVDQSPSIDADR